MKGLKARGNVIVDIEWKDGRITRHRLAAPEPREVKVRVNGRLQIQRTQPL